MIKNKISWKMDSFRPQPYFDAEAEKKSEEKKLLEEQKKNEENK